MSIKPCMVLCSPMDIFRLWGVCFIQLVYLCMEFIEYPISYFTEILVYAIIFSAPDLLTRHILVYVVMKLVLSYATYMDIRVPVWVGHWDNIFIVGFLGFRHQWTPGSDHIIDCAGLHTAIVLKKYSSLSRCALYYILRIYYIREYWVFISLRGWNFHLHRWFIYAIIPTFSININGLLCYISVINNKDINI